MQCQRLPPPLPLQAARSYIEAAESEASESVLSVAADRVMSLGKGETTTALVIKTDEAFVEACSSHGAALARLSAVVKAGSAFAATSHATADAMIALSRAALALSNHERTHAAAGTSAAAAVAAAAETSKRAQAALFAGGAGGAAPTAPPPTDAAAAAFAIHSAAANADTSSISGMFKADFHDPYSSLHTFAPPAAKVEVSGKADVYSGGYADSLADLLLAFGNQAAMAGGRVHDHTNLWEEVLIKRLR